MTCVKWRYLDATTIRTTQTTGDENQELEMNAKKEKERVVGKMTFHCGIKIVLNCDMNNSQEMANEKLISNVMGTEILHLPFPLVLELRG